MEATLAETSSSRYAGRRKLIENRQRGNNVILYANEDAPEFFADGFGGIQGMATISKVDFFKITSIEMDDDPAYGPREIREVNLRVVIPTAQLIEALFNMIDQLRKNGQALRATQKNSDAFLEAQFKRLGI